MTAIPMRHFSSIEGRAVPRFGTATYIGCKKVKKKGFVFDTAKVVSIPVSETEKYLKDYANAVRRGDLRELTEADALVAREAHNKAEGERQKALAEERRSALAEAEGLVNDASAPEGSEGDTVSNAGAKKPRVKKEG